MPLPVLSLALVVFALTTGEFVTAGILPDVAAGVSVSVPAAGLLVTAYAAGMIVGGPLVTLATARLARRPLVAGLVAVSVLGNLGSALAPNYAVLLAARFVAGLVVATFFAIAIATAVSFAPDRAGTMVARVSLGMNLGIVAGTPLGTLVGQQFGWRATFAVVAGLGAAGLLLTLRYVPPAPATGSARGELRVFARRSVVLAILLTAVGNVGVVMVYTYLNPLLTGLAGIPVGAVPLLLAGYGVGAVLGNLLGGRLADRALLPWLVALLAALAGLLAAGWFAGTGPIGVAGCTVALGLLAYAIIPGMQARVLSAASDAPRLAVAVNASGFQLAAALAGWLGGRVVASGLGLRGLYPVAAALTAAGLLLALYLLRRDRSPRGDLVEPQIEPAVEGGR